MLDRNKKSILKKKGLGDMSCNEFKGKIALVTGAAQGIGKTVASMLAERGAEVACCRYKPFSSSITFTFS